MQELALQKGLLGGWLKAIGSHYEALERQNIRRKRTLYYLQFCLGEFWLIGLPFWKGAREIQCDQANVPKVKKVLVKTIYLKKDRYIDTEIDRW